ncbi:hypothetical protein DI392_12810 [Vibrio albus]|uniref:Uncharacterized protein n=1 Tax=Vibrio albus TaxID=2200953 RepID=A0A2U3B8U4_9VIBR|nr:hypothetical protein DI392_12810 [Vibrio albus]
MTVLLLVFTFPLYLKKGVKQNSLRLLPNLNWSLSSLINLFDYHQRVPTQIDRFKLLKSVALKLSSKRTAILAR